MRYNNLSILTTENRVKFKFKSAVESKRVNFDRWKLLHGLPKALMSALIPFLADGLNHDVQTQKSFLNLANPNKVWIVITIFR